MAGRCDKRRFPSRARATAALEHIRRRGARTSEGKPCRVYLCPDCKGWHLTSRLAGW